MLVTERVRVEGAAPIVAPDPGTETLFGRTLRAWREVTRAELELPAGGPLVVSGHQPMVWHAGILAKDLLADALAESSGGHAVHLVVDQDTGAFAQLDVPTRDDHDEAGVTRVALGVAAPRVIAARRAPLRPAALPADRQPLTDDVARGLDRINAAVRAASGAPSLAAHVAAVTAQCRAPWLATEMHTLPATRVMETSFVRALLDHLDRDPAACARAYHRAIRAHADAGLTTLTVRDDWIEIPFWRIRPDGTRQRAWDDDIARATDGGDALAPRALAMTAIVRLALGDLFVHGLGGARYDRVMESWIAEWLGVTPAPMAVATADAFLTLPDDERRADAADPEALRQAARRAWHDPEPPRRDRPAGPGPVKQDLLDAIAAAPRGSSRRDQAYRAMHEQLALLRSRHIGRVEALQRRARDAARDAEFRALAARRDWAFPFLADATLRALRDDVRAALR